MRIPALLLCLAIPLHAQEPRPVVQVNPGPTSNGGQTAIAAGGNLSAICWNDASTDEVFVATSDGRGITWGAAVRVDNDASGKTTELDSVHVSGDSVYVVYESSGSLHFARSTDRGATFSGPLPLDVGPGSTNSWAVAATRVGGVDHIHVVSATSVIDDDLYITSSVDDGASFGSAVPIPGSAGDVDEIDLGAFENVVHVVWDDNQSGRDTVYYQRSIDSGSNFLPAGVPLGDNPGVEDSQAPLRLAVSGNTVAVMWNEEPTGSGDEVIQANVSQDAGATFSGPKTVGATPPGADADEGDIAVDATTGAVIVVFEDNRAGSDEAFAAASFTGGATWLPDVMLSNGGAEKPRLASGARSVVATWETTLFPRLAESRESTDGGASWGPALEISDPAFGSADFVTLAYDDVYRNYIQTWTALNGSNLDVFAGGFRPQTLTPVGWTVGATTVSFDLDRFDPSFPLAGVLVSGGVGSLPLPFGDGRDAGLLLDGLLLTSVNLFGSALGATLDASGSGSTPSVPITLPPGFAVWAVGYQLGFGGGAVVFGDLSDVVGIGS